MKFVGARTARWKMNEVFFLLLAIFGSHVEGVKIRATRKRWVQYRPSRQIVPFPDNIQHLQRLISQNHKAPIYGPSKIYTYVAGDGARYNLQGGHVQRVPVKQAVNGRHSVNRVHHTVVRPVIYSRSGIDQRSLGADGELITRTTYRDGGHDGQIDYSANRRDTVSGYNVPTNDNGNRVTRNENSTNEGLLVNDFINAYNERNNDAVSSTATSDLIVENEGYFTTADKSEQTGGKNDLLNNTSGGVDINKGDNSVPKLEATENNMLPPVDRQSESEDSLQDNEDEDNGNNNAENIRHVRIVLPDTNRIYFGDQSNLNSENSVPYRDVVNVINVNDEESSGQVNSAPETDLVTQDYTDSMDEGTESWANKAPPRNIMDVINVYNQDSTGYLKPENDVFFSDSIDQNKRKLAKEALLRDMMLDINAHDGGNTNPVHLVAESDLTSTSDENNQGPINNIAYERHRNVDKEKEARVLLLKYILKLQQHPIKPYVPMNGNIALKLVNPNSGRQHDLIVSDSDVERPKSTENTTPLQVNQLIFKICQNAESLLKRYKTKNINVPLDITETSDDDANVATIHGTEEPMIIKPDVYTSQVYLHTIPSVQPNEGYLQTSIESERNDVPVKTQVAVGDEIQPPQDEDSQKIEDTSIATETPDSPIIYLTPNAVNIGSLSANVPADDDVLVLSQPTPSETYETSTSSILHLSPSEYVGVWNNEPERVLDSNAPNAPNIPKGYALGVAWSKPKESPHLKETIDLSPDISDRDDSAERMNILEIPEESTISGNYSSGEVDLSPAPEETMFNEPNTSELPIYYSSDSDDGNISEQSPNLEEITPEKYILQVLQGLQLDLLRLYYSKCNPTVGENLLQGLKSYIVSVLDKECEAT